MVSSDRKEIRILCTMKDCLIVSILLVVQFRCCYFQIFNEDEYEKNLLLNQFRRHVQQDRRQQVIHSREGISYHGFSPYDRNDVEGYDDGDDFYRRNNYRMVAPYAQKSPWLRQHLARVGFSGSAPTLDVGRGSATKSMEDEEIDHIGALGQSGTSSHSESEQQTEKTIPVSETFRVETRAGLKQYSSSSSSSVTSRRHPVEEVASPVNDMYFIAVVAGCSAAAIFGVIAAGFCWYKFQKNAKAAAEAEYPAYGVTGPNKEHISPSGGGDRKLAQNAQMYHYQHQKQQMIAMEKNNGERQVSTSDLDSEEENEEGDYTVYECPGLAPTGEMEVKNPLFQDEPTPASPPISGGKPLLISGGSIDGGNSRE